MQDWIEKADRFLLNTYKRPPVVFDHGEGAYLFDLDGTRYLDFIAGIGVNALGYNHPIIQDGIEAAAKKVIHTSNLYFTQAQIELAELLVSKTFESRVFFVNSGSEAVETALKISRKWGKQFQPARTKILAFEHSFHGRTMGAVSATYTAKYREPFEPLIAGVVFLPFNDPAALDSIDFTDFCCAIVEPIQGEGGITPATPEFLSALRDKTRQANVALIFDEIQCGVSRSGKLYAYQHYGIEPDILTTAKALGAGFPISAALVKPEFADVIHAGDHGSTFGGNPFIAHVAKQTFAFLSSDAFLSHVNAIAGYFDEQLQALTSTYPFITRVKGMGLMKGLEVDSPVLDLVQDAFENKLLVARAGSNVLRFLPPLIIEKEQVDEAISILNHIFKTKGV
ncbi:MAG: acetylornithine/succinylornithine family transaminase [Calditrichaeota bacterium]|nr:acetylornithine/succinylornithine family transaminase [Calditrichota bacterium]